MGAPAFLGLLALVRRRKWSGLIPPLTILAVSLVVAINPFDLFGDCAALESIGPNLPQLVFPGRRTLAAPPLTAYGIDYCLSRKRRPLAGWCVVLTCLLLAGWSARQMLVWFPVGSDFLTGWNLL